MEEMMKDQAAMGDPYNQENQMQMMMKMMTQ